MKREYRRILSSMIVGALYEEDERNLQVVFKNGSLYQYSFVEPEVFEQLTQSESAGKYFHDNIRDRYPTEKLK